MLSLNRTRLLTSTLLLSGAIFVVPAHAQEAAPAEQTAEQTAEQPTDEQTVVVTGSRILSPNITSVAPVQSVGVEQIQDSGITNVQELLLENPAFGTPALSRTNSAFLTSGTGVATVDLRNLGSDRTLVLINGRRVVAGVPGTATVDLNVIPTQFIERIDILTGGSSSLYGSDAVAGVVNFIYKDNFQGIEATGQYGITERGDDARYQASLTAGGNFADDRGNVMIHFGYSKEEGVKSSQRRNTYLDDLDTFFFVTGDPKDYGVPFEGALSGFAPQGRFTTENGDFTFDRNNNLTNWTSSAVNGFNRQAFRTIAVPVERYLFAARGRFDVTDSIRLFAEGTYANTRSSREIEPFALASEDISPATGGLIPLETLVNGVLVANPFVPTAVINSATDGDGDGLRDYAFARRLSDIATRNGRTNRDLYRFVVGLEGDLFDNKFRWDVSYNYGRTTESQSSNGQVNVLNFANALRAIPDLNDVDQDGNTSEVICADANARAQGCVPINVFGFNSISPAAAAYVAAEQTFQTEITQQQIQANLSGELFNLPAGPVGIAVGAEYRRETSREDNDALTNAGLNAGNAIPDTSGAFDVKELYGELNIPILADTAFFQSLNLRAAGRISDYSTVGTVYTYNVGGDWEPVKGVRFRGTYARSVRAPNIGELFTGPSQTFPTGIQDPCEGVGATGGGALGDRCRAAPGVSANIAANGGAFTVTQLDAQGVSGFNSGNPDLNEEKSTSWTVGVVVAPRHMGGALGRLQLSVDYFNISIEDAIVAPPRNFILNQCYVEGNDEFCDLVDRRAAATPVNSAGSLEFVDAPLVNGGIFKVRGLDAVLNWSTPVNVFGDAANLGLRVSYTRLMEGFLTPIPGAPKDPFAGEIGSAKDRFTATAVYSTGDFRWTFTGTYIGQSLEDDQIYSPGEALDTIKIPSEFYLDTQINWSASRNFEFFFGIDNLLDNDAPNILSGSGFNTTGTDTAADVYDVFGRRFFSGVRLRF
ncbi:TonB-dependent receptor [Sphingomonas sp.]|uniref:TonB-dependent receptor domain-containing protein n=1 Tax=Sphingomonas sp. TaxID=28214 RepID=UPI0031D9E1D3